MLACIHTIIFSNSKHKSQIPSVTQYIINLRLESNGMHLITSAEWPQIDSGEWQWGTMKTQGHDIIKGWKPIIDQHFRVTVTGSKLTNISVDTDQSLTVHSKLHRTCWNTHYSVNIICRWSQYSWSCSMCMQKKVWLLHVEKPNRILEDLPTLKICRSFKDPSKILEFAEILKEIYKDLITIKYK